MTTVVLDASVVVKWIFPGQPREPHAAESLEILQQIQQARLPVLQPPHWLAEVAAVVMRLEPAVARRAVALLYALEFPVMDEAGVYEKACDLAGALRHHLFDTLYHAVALATPDGTLVTADEAYYRKARGIGRILRLRDFGAP